MIFDGMLNDTQIRRFCKKISLKWRGIWFRDLEESIIEQTCTEEFTAK
jgi:hypothetical protein